MKKIFSIVVVLLMLVSTIGLNSVSAKNLQDLTLTSQFACAIDQDSGKVLYNKDMNTKMYPASITKIVTIMTALDMIKDVDAKLTITEKDLETVYETGASAANFAVGEEVTYEDLLMGALIPSGADATRALADHLCNNSQEKFVSKMNAYAKKCGAKNSHFANTTGIHDENHYTTAYDMALITRNACDNKQFKKLFAISTFTSSNKLHVWTKKNVRNAHKSGIDISMFKGTKSGYTDEAQHTLSTLVEEHNHEFVIVTGHGQDTDTLTSVATRDTVTIANYLKDNYSEQTIIKKGTKLKDIDVTYGSDDLVVNANEDINLILPKNVSKSSVKISYNIKSLTAPIKKGTKIGTMTIKYKGTTKYKKELYASKDVKKDTLAYILQTIKGIIFPYGIALILVLVFIKVCRIPTKKRTKR
ncbi:MAG: D-alanyl-D-alanine carboxypeptidase [Thomasclavelia sp.]|nr:D-alanyl-D-alanine carboxypeptidase [Thomasclavelia sp.]